MRLARRGRHKRLLASLEGAKGLHERTPLHLGNPSVQGAPKLLLLPLVMVLEHADQLTEGSQRAHRVLGAHNVQEAQDLLVVPLDLRHPLRHQWLHRRQHHGLLGRDVASERLDHGCLRLWLVG